MREERWATYFAASRSQWLIVILSDSLHSQWLIVISSDSFIFSVIHPYSQWLIATPSDSFHSQWPIPCSVNHRHYQWPILCSETQRHSSDPFHAQWTIDIPSDPIVRKRCEKREGVKILHARRFTDPKHRKIQWNYRQCAPRLYYSNVGYRFLHMPAKRSQLFSDEKVLKISMLEDLQTPNIEKYSGTIDSVSLVCII